MQAAEFIHREPRTRTVVHHHQAHRVRVLGLVHLVGDEQSVESCRIGTQVIEVAVVITLEPTRDGAAVGFGVEDVPGAIPRVHERTRLLGGEEDGERHGDDADAGADDSQRRPHRIDLLEPEALHVGHRHAIRLAIDGREEAVVLQQRRGVRIEADFAPAVERHADDMLDRLAVRVDLQPRAGIALDDMVTAHHVEDQNHHAQRSDGAASATEHDVSCVGERAGRAAASMVVGGGGVKRVVQAQCALTCSPTAARNSL
jgi:hypothetical protein